MSAFYRLSAASSDAAEAVFDALGVKERQEVIGQSPAIGTYQRLAERNERADNDPVAWADSHADDIRYLRARRRS